MKPHQPASDWAVKAQLGVGTLYITDCACGAPCSWIALDGLFSTGPVRRPLPKDK